MSHARTVDPHTSVEAARGDVFTLAMAPLFFQAARVARDNGVFQALYEAGAEGATVAAVAGQTGASRYAVTVLLEAGAVSGLCQQLPGADGVDPVYALTKAGVFWLKDELARRHADFTHHVCYRGAFHLDAALRDGVPAGLDTLGAGSSTVYQALAALEPTVRAAWDDFNCGASETAFAACLPLLSRGRRVVDIGANTGRFAELVLEHDAAAELTLVDHPAQLAQARERLRRFAGRVHEAPVDLLDPAAALPAGGDVYWMSQVLDCFSETEVVSILSRVRQAMGPDSVAFILETFVDTQTSPGARAAVVGTSLYFSCIANGTSRMYSLPVMRRMVAEAGLAVVEEHHGLGVAHSLLRVRRP